MKRCIWLAGIGLLASCAGGDEAVCELEFTDRGEVRVFVVGHQHSLAEAESYEAYQASYQRHADAIAPCLSASRPNLLVFPESAGLTAMMIGDRSRMARHATKSMDAFVATLEAYRAPYQHYQTKFPEISLARSMTLSVSDVVWRAITRTFGGMAKQHQVWVLTNADVPRMEHSTDPTLIATLGDPSLPASEGIYVATSPEVLNSSLLFSPAGELVGRVDKVFLTDPEEGSLDLENGSLAGPLVLDTPFAKIGVAISRDAWYPPFTRRTEDLGAELIVQPEAFSGGWTVATGVAEEWIPDVFLSSGWLHTQKHRFRYSVAPQLVGNFFEIPFDGQVHIVKKASPADETTGYVGQEAMPGFAAIGPWALEDPQGDLRSRREALRAAGEGLVGSDAYVEATIAADLSMKAEPIAVERDATREESSAIAPSGSDQRDPDLTSFGDGALLVFAEAGVRAARLSANGWSEPEVISEGGARPAVCARGDDALVVWQEGAPESIQWARLDRTGVVARGALAPSAGPQWEPDCAILEQEILVVFEDLSRGFPRLMWARSDRDTIAFSLGGEVDPSSAEERRVQGSQSQPSLSSEGDLVWIDYRDRSWDVYYARWMDGAFTASTRIDGITSESERLHSDPRVLRNGTEVIVAFAALFDRRPHPDVRIVRSSDGQVWTSETVPGGAHERDAGFLGGGGRPRFAPDLAIGSEGLRVVFQDLAPDKSAVFGFGSSVDRIDDTGSAPVSLLRPRIAIVADRSVVVWEDDRDGVWQIYGVW